MTWVPLAVIGFCTAMAVVGEVLQASDGGVGRSLAALPADWGNRAAGRRCAQASFGRRAVRAARSRCRSASAAPADFHSSWRRPMARAARPSAVGGPTAATASHPAASAIARLPVCCRSGSLCGARPRSRRSRPTCPSMPRRWKTPRRCVQRHPALNGGEGPASRRSPMHADVLPASVQLQPCGGWALTHRTRRPAAAAGRVGGRQKRAEEGAAAGAVAQHRGPADCKVQHAGGRHREPPPALPAAACMQAQQGLGCCCCLWGHRPGSCRPAEPRAVGPADVRCERHHASPAPPAALPPARGADDGLHVCVVPRHDPPLWRHGPRLPPAL